MSPCSCMGDTASAGAGPVLRWLTADLQQQQALPNAVSLQRLQQVWRIRLGCSGIAVKVSGIRP